MLDLLNSRLCLEHLVINGCVLQELDGLVCFRLGCGLFLRWWRVLNS
jgi:hypothetical protein